METKDVLRTRRSVRKYKSDPIPEEDLAEILEAACHAPSGVNLQPWYFVAVTSPEGMAGLREIMGRVTDKFRPVLTERFAKHPETVKQTESFLISLGARRCACWPSS